jgi:hypothetical protein
VIGFASLFAGTVSLLLLVAVAMKAWLASCEMRNPMPDACAEDATEPCPEEFVSRVFLRGDWEFVRGLKAQSIERMFGQERKRIARIWVRQTSLAIRKVMGEHAQAARHSKNLKVGTEIKIFAEFLAVLAACGVMSITIQIAGPLWLGGLARWAQRLSQEATRMQESIQAGILVKADGSGAA